MSLVMDPRSARAVSRGGKKKMKKTSSSPIVFELKKGMLKEHLDEVKSLVERWNGELSAPNPFEYQRERHRWGWESAYVPSTETDSDNNHTVRRHLPSRRLWRYHSDWQREINGIMALLPGLQKEARAKLAELSGKETRWKRTEDYLPIALHEAFWSLYHGEVRRWYKFPDLGPPGFAWGAFRIEDTATSEEDGKAVAAEHLRLIGELSQLPGMKDLAESRWRNVCLLQDRMRGLVRTAIKANDILYPCKFCRHLWVP